MKFSRANLFTKPKVKFSDPSAPLDTKNTHLSPSAMVAKRFFRNRLALVGLMILVFMFAFSFLGGFLSPYGESQVFEGISYTDKTIASVFTNDEYRFYAGDGQAVSAAFKSKFLLAVGRGLETFDADNQTYTLTKLSDDTYILSSGDVPRYLASKDVMESDADLSFDVLLQVFTAAAENAAGFTYEGAHYVIEFEGDNIHILQNGTEIAVLSRLVVRGSDTSGTIDPSLKSAIFEAIEADTNTFSYDFGFGTESLGIKRDSGGSYSVIRTTAVRRILVYEPPSSDHWLGTDANGMDIFTRLIYGGRISLSIGFVVIAIEILIGVLLGGIAGYFGGFFDALIMRIVDIFNCIPTWPIIIIIGALMDSQRIDPKIRIYYLMLVLGLLGWPGMARMIRGQILSLREQEFMIAAEATGLRVSRRIFRHLVPNVIPQLIVMATMGLGSIILTESTLSFLGLGVKFPYASWGNIIQAVTSVYVMTNYPFVWIPAGFLILITVLGFNFAGDGLRDAFDPRMKR